MILKKLRKTRSVFKTFENYFLFKENDTQIHHGIFKICKGHENNKNNNGRVMAYPFCISS